MERPVNQFPRVRRQQIAQVIESRLLGGHIGDVGEIGVAPCLGRHALLNEPD